MNLLELRPTQTEHFAQFGRIEFLDFWIDGIPLRQQLSFSKYDELLTKEPTTDFEKLTQEAHQRYGHLLTKPGEQPSGYGEMTLKAMIKYEPSRFYKGSDEHQWDAMHELLLRGDPPPAQRRCRLYGCYRCTCHAVTGVIEMVDDCFVWHSFLDEYPWQSARVELGGGPFFFDAESYMQAMEGAVRIDP